MCGQSNIQKLFEENPDTDPSYDNPDVRAALAADGVPEYTVEDVLFGFAKAVNFLTETGEMSDETAGRLAELSGAITKELAKQRVAAASEDQDAEEDESTNG